MTQEERLFHRYIGKLEELRTSFNRDPIAPFISTNFLEGSAPVFGDWFSAWQSDTIHIYSDQDLIFKELLGFSALVSYMSLSYRRSLYFLHVVFLLRFKSSSDSMLKTICAKIYEGVADEQEKAKDDSFLYYRQIIDFLTEQKFLFEYLPVLPISLTFSEFYNSISPIWYDLLGKRFQFDDIAKSLSEQESQFALLFSRKKKKQEWRDLYQKFLGESDFLMQYDKLGLSTYFGILILNPLLQDPIEIIYEVAKIPFFRGFHGNHLEFRFYIIIPEEVKSNVVAYFQTLKSQNFIIHFEIRNYVSYKTVLQYDSRVSKSKLVRNLFPFNSTDWKFTRARKTLPQHQHLKVFQFNFSPQKEENYARNFLWTPLHLYLTFNRDKLFKSLFQYKNSSSLFLFVQQNLLGFYHSFDLNLTPKVVTKLVEYSKSGEISEKTINSNLVNENLTIIKKIASALHYNLKSDGKVPFWERMWKEYIFFQETFRNKQNFSKITLQKTMDQLIESQILQENRPLQFNNIAGDSLDSLNMFVESYHRISILEISIMSYTLETWRTKKEGLIYRYHLAIPAMFWSSFNRLFFDIPDCRVYCAFHQVQYKNEEDLVLYYDYPAQLWNLTKFNMQLSCSNHFLNQTKNHLDLGFVPPRHHHDISPQKMNSAETIYHFSSMIATSKRLTLIENQLTKSHDDYLKFLEQWVEKKQTSELTMKKLLKNKFSLEFNQISQIVQNINFRMVSLPQYRNMQKVVIILQEYFFPSHPDVLLVDPLLSGLFCHGIQRISLSGGGSNGLLLLEYELPSAILNNPKSQINQLIYKINSYFHIDIQFLPIHHEYRFYSEQILHRRSMKRDGFSHLKQTKNEGVIMNPNIIHHDFVEKKIITPNQPQPVYCSSIWKWPMWQIIGYPIEIGIFLKISPSIQKSVINYLMKLPIGTIYVHDRDRTESDDYIIAKIRCVKNVFMVLLFLSNHFKKLGIHSQFSFLTDYTIINNKNVNELLTQAESFELLRTSEGDFLEIPLNVNERRFSLQERVELYNVLKENLTQQYLIITTRGWRIFCEKLSKIKNLCVAREKIKTLISETLHVRSE